MPIDPKAKFAAPLLFACLLALISLACLPSATLAAEVPQPLWQSPSDGDAGSGAGELDHPNGIAADPTTGHIYVADRYNARVSEYDAWGEFVKSWGWGVADGNSELQTCGPQASPPTTNCLKGLSGTGPGQFALPLGGVAVDAAGDIYVGDTENFRVQKFDSDGDFLLMFGGGVNVTTGGDICTAASENMCGPGSSGEGDGQFTSGPRNYIAAGPVGTVFVGGNKGRIQEFEPNGSFKSSVVLEGELGGKRVKSLAVDGGGLFYVIPDDDDKHIYKFSPAGSLLSTITTSLYPESPIAVDAAGNIYAVGQRSLASGGFVHEVIEFAPDGKPLVSLGSGFGVQENLSIEGLATSTVTVAGDVDVYLSVTSAGSANPVGTASAYGPAPDKWPPPAFPPDIASQYATAVGTDYAVLKADINPRFWADTTFSVEYGTGGKCSEGGCTLVQPASPTKLGAGGVGSPVPSKGLLLSDLTPATAYHYRFVAQSGGGGPVRGIGSGEVEGIFTTRSVPSGVVDDCPNRSLRAGVSAHLADCRAYEMVSPVDKNGTDIAALININANPATLNQSAAGGDRLTYSTSQGFGDTQGVSYMSQYIASRDAEGWQNHGITPPQGRNLVEVGVRIDVDFRSFTRDLCSATLLGVTDAPLAPGAVEGFPNLYRRQNCGVEGYEALTTSPPPTQTPEGFTHDTDVQGVSSDGGCTVFRAADQLTPDANPGSKVGGDPGSNEQVYESCGGATHLVSVLPNGSASTADSSVGTGAPQLGIRVTSAANAVSGDGGRVYWTASQAEGPLYLRENATQGQSKVSAGTGKCTQPAKACTFPVSGSVSPTAVARFWAAAADGSKALFTVDMNGAWDDLYEFDAGSKSSTLVASGVKGLVGAGEDASRFYFVSDEALAPGAAAGKPNLYLRESGTFRYIATLAKADVEPGTPFAYLSVEPQPYKRSARVSPDGRHLVFMSEASLTGYDNTDALNGKAAAEVFAYNAETGALSCVSCNPTGARPVGRAVPIEAKLLDANWAAGFIPGFASQLYGSRAITDDGQRVFFNSYESLVPGDTNGRTDVYQWEAPGSGDCEETAPAFSPLNGGCLSLISSGESGADSEFVDASADGTDVFFATDSSLVPQDPGLIDIYDARVNGGYPVPPGPPAACEGEACQGPVVPPNDPTPASAAFQGAGNVVEKRKPARKKARKKKGGKKKGGKHSGTKTHQNRRGAGNDRRAQR